MKINNKIITRYLPPIVWAFLIFILSAIPGSDYPEAVFNYSPFAHFIEFFILTILVLRAVKLNNKNIWLVLIICSLYAISDEIHQIFVLNRSASLLDWLLDFLAIIIAIKFYLYKKQKGLPSLSFRPK